MPKNLRVPSKGALRALRNLALGTTCAAAFGAGVITEDRRRRILSAREVHNNALKIKAARGYHGQGTALLSSLDDSAVEEGIWLTGDPALRKLTRETNRTARDAEKEIIIPGYEPGRPGPTARYDPSELLSTDQPSIPLSRYDPAEDLLADPEVDRPRELRWTRNEIHRLKMSPTATDRQQSLPVFACEWKERPKPEPSTPRIDIKRTIGKELPDPQDRQRRIARDVLNLLQDPESPDDVDAAAMRLLDALEEGVETGGEGLVQPLVDAAASVSEACKKHGKFSDLERILDMILNYTPHGENDHKQFGLHEVDYNRFSPLVVIQNLLSRSGNKISPATALPRTTLEKASSLYLMKLRNKPRMTSTSHWNIGERLCRETCLAGLHKLTRELWFRLQTGRAEQGLTPVAVAELIRATRSLNLHDEIFGFYSTFYSQTSPDKVDAHKIADEVIESIFQAGNLEQAEEALFIADQIALRCGFPNSTTPILKVIGLQWRTARDILQIDSLFKRLEPLAHRVHHPQAVYSAIIQCCIEAGAEDAAHEYYANYKQVFKPEKVDLRIYGHFALARAMEGDWAGAINYLKNMAQLIDSNNQGDYERCFIPILKLFDKSHPVHETESFVRDFIDKHGLQLTDHLFNTMINVYSKAKEINSLVRWINYGASVGRQIDTVSFNTILTNCHAKWGFAWPEILQLYNKIRKLSGLTVQSKDKITLEILTRCALSGISNNQEIENRLKFLAELGRSASTWDSTGVYHAMATAFKRWDYGGALAIYRMAPEKGVLLDSRHTTMAVKASLEFNGRDLTDTIRIISDAQEDQQNVSLPVATLIIHQMDHFGDISQSFGDQILAFVESALNPLENHGIPVSQKILTHAMRHLEKRQLFRQAIDFWKSMCQRLNISTSAIELETLNVLMRIYLQLKDAGGVRWVIDTLSANRIVPDKHLLVQVKNAKKAALAARIPIAEDFVRSVKSAVVKVLKMREEAEKEKQLVRDVTVGVIEKAIRDQEQRSTTVIDERFDRSGKENLPAKKQQRALKERAVARSAVMRRVYRSNGTGKPVKLEWEDRPGLPPPRTEISSEGIS